MGKLIPMLLHDCSQDASENLFIML